MIRPNSLYHADSLTLLERIDGGVARTIYLDPPWFSQPSIGTRGSGSRVANGLRDYLDNFARVLQQCHRILADDGSIIVHAEPSLGQKFALLLEQIFRDNHVDDYILPQFGMNQGVRHAALLHYGKSQNTLLNDVCRPVEESEHVRNPDDDPRGAWRAVDLTTRMDRPMLQFEWRGHQPPIGRSWRYQLSELERLADEGRIHFSAGGSPPRLKAYQSERRSVPVGTIWDDLQPLRGGSAERVGFPSQQPVALIERVILRTSNPDDLVIDPYCGSGTSLVAAHRQDRCWIGCDSSPEAIELTRARLSTAGIAEGWHDRSAPDLMAIEAKPIFLRRVVTMVEDLNAAEVLIAEGESEFVEWKVSAYWNAFNSQKDEKNKEKLIRSVAAFLNSQDGGTILIGVANDGTLPGLIDDYKATNSQRPGRDSYELWMRQTLRDRLGKEFDPFVKIAFDEVRGQDVCIIRVAGGNRPACNLDKLPIRRGNQTVDLPLKEAIEYSRIRWPL
ncbi:Modification methylase DpnIIB [Gemmata obscuriglobus]|nr:Modification methylase DpnIIB [Gemmata obscuriglobus]VTS09550.1 dna methylase n-4 n-6 domain protein : Divergent AAA domain protein OS=Burkholderia thailandensis MSMB59 GN=BTHA_495 PE=4 SV=1: N6_N4_Mtase: AAA_4 [Gemmata obscuriglobus UQM 2246]